MGWLPGEPEDHQPPSTDATQNPDCSGLAAQNDLQKTEDSLEERLRLLEGQNLGTTQSLEVAAVQISSLLAKNSELEAALLKSFEDIRLLDSEYKAQLALVSQEPQALAEENQALALSLSEADYLIQHQVEQLETLMIRLTLSMAELERVHTTADRSQPPQTA